MQKRAGLLTVFIFFFLLASLVFFLFRNHTFPIIGTVAETITFPLQRSLYSAFGGVFGQKRDSIFLQRENQELAKKLVDQSELMKEAKALRDQYDQANVSPKALLPARVIGMGSFLPGVSLPETLILDKGTKQRVAVGQTVILANNVIGNIIEVSNERSLVSLISNKKQSVTGKTNKTNALGIIKGQGSGMLVFDNVVLSDILEKGDIVATKGDKDTKGVGYPPDLVIGKITSIDKKASDLFQSAEVESFVDFSRLSTVFIMVENK